MQRTFALAVALGMLCVAGLWSQEKEKATRSDEAKRVSEQFTKALVMDMNLKEVMKQVGVPTLWRRGDAIKVIHTMEDLKEEYDILMNNMKPYKGTLKFASIDSYGAIAGKPAEVLKNSDRVVEWQIKGEDGGFAKVNVFVAWRDGQAKVVAFSMGMAEPSTDKKASN